MTISRKQKTRRISKTNEQKEAGKKLETFLKKNKIKDGDEISLAIYRLFCLNFTGKNEPTLKIVHDKLPIAFDKYIERGFKLTGQEKIFLQNNKETIISLMKYFYWEDNGEVVGVNFQMRLPDYVDGFCGFFNLDTDNFAM